MPRWLFLPLVGLLFCAHAPLPAMAAGGKHTLPDRQAREQTVLPPGLFQDGGYLVSRQGRIIAARNPEKLLIPASTWKIATALLALEHLGADFRFETLFYLDRQNNLIIQGLGDPLLVSEEIALIAGRLAAGGLAAVEAVLIDDSFFALEEARPTGAGRSHRAYDAANGALVVNFNTVYLEKSAAGVVRSAEEQTPELPLLATLAADLPPGRHRLNLSRQPEDGLRYSRELFGELLRREGIEVKGVKGGKEGKGEVGRAVVPADARLLYRHRSSRSLARVVELMLLYSNNFVANQLLLAVAGRQEPPATWERGRRVLADFLAAQGLDPASYRADEGSGLSRENLITPQALLQLLELFRPHAALLPHWRERHPVKSGTLTGVYAYAGYFRPEGDFRNPATLDPFVLILNQPANRREEALQALEKYWRRK